MSDKTYLNRLTIFAVLQFILCFTHSSPSYSQACNNWLNVPNQPSFVRIGDLDVAGNQITVEAMFNRTAPWNGVDLFQGDLVSKHEDPRDCNYLLRPGSAEITTTNGYFKTPTICNIQLNKTYHAAMVYDGKALKFYRNGFLMSQIAASGNLVLNNWQTQIGLYFNQLTQENFIGYINEVRIWNIARTQDEIKLYMNQSLPSPSTQNGLQAYYVFDNLLNKQGNSMWNGSLHGSASIGKTNSNCTFVADSCNLTPCTNVLPPDFGFEQDICNPKRVKFHTNSANVRTYQWSFGSGQTSTERAPTIDFNNFGTYSIELKVEYNSGCTSKIVKNIPIGVEQDDLIVTNDTTICSGDSVLLRTKSMGLGYCWQPNASLTGFIAKPGTSTTYTYTSRTLGNNLVVNGDFTNGATGFSSAYMQSGSGIPPGVYMVGTNPSAWNPAMSTCRDHTTATGNMLMVNGAEQKNVAVWSQTVSVTPNTNYAFSTWLQTITTINPAQLRFSINGEQIGDLFTADAQSCLWKQFYTTWNSGSATTAIISILNMNEVFSGNDFALDDIYFGPVSIKQEPIKINVVQLPEISLGADKTVCMGSSIQLNAGLKDASVVKWTPALYLNNAEIVNPTSTPLQSISYIAEALNQSGCSRKDTLNIFVTAKPVIAIRPDTAICQGQAVVLTTTSSNATSFSWHPISGLSNASSPNPIASPSTTIEYVVTAVNEGCEAKDTIELVVHSLPEVSLSEDTTICENTFVELKASGGIEYKWFPSNGLSATNSPNPIARPANTTTYKVDVLGTNGCTRQDSVTVAIFTKPQFRIQPQTHSICTGETVVLSASGGDTYTWLLQDGTILSTASSIKVNPITTTTYKVLISESNCSTKDSLFSSVAVNPKPIAVITKSNDIDCAYGEAQLSASGGTAYEWFPTAGLSNVSISNPIATPSQTTTYFVNVKSSNGCITKDSTTVKVTSNGKGGYHIPSAFTPNGDGKNDCFTIKSWLGVQDFSIEIFNRWGERVFVSNKLPFCWNGTYKGKEQPQGVYVYQVKAKTLCGDIYKKGTLTLIK